MLSLLSPGAGPIPPGYYYPKFDRTQTVQTARQAEDRERDYRLANKYPLVSEGYSSLMEELEDEWCKNMPSRERYCLENGQPIAPVVNGRRFYGNGYQGQAKWRALHEWALSQPANPVRNEPYHREQETWLENFIKSLPCGECRRGARKWVKENPFPLVHGREALWKHSYLFHNAIRDKLGQPLIPEAEARAEYEETV